MRLIVIFTLSWLELGVHGTMANRCSWLVFLPLYEM